MKRPLLIIAMALAFCSSAATVKIQIENGTKQEVTIMVGVVSGVDALPRNYKPAFQLKESGADATKTYQNDNIDKGATLFVYAVLAKGGKTKPQEFQINKKEFTDNMLILVTQEEINDEQSVSDITSKFKDFSKTKSNYHETVDIGKDEAFKSIFGSMILVDKDSNIIMRITSRSLKSDRMDYHLTGQDFNTQKDFKREAIVKLNGSIPLAADLNYMFGNSDMSSFTWNVKNAGFIPWSHPDGKTEIELFYKSLDSLTLNYLADLYIKDSTIKMYFIDRVYMIESYNLKSHSFKKLTSDAEINVTVYGSGTSNYVRSSESTIEVTKTNIITDVWGSDHSDLLRQNAKNKLGRLRTTLSNTSDLKIILPIYNLLQEYDPLLPVVNTSNINLVKTTTLNNINALDKKIKIQ